MVFSGLLMYGHTDQEEGMHDGMDMTLCCFDRKKQVLYFSSAINPLILIRNEEIQSYRGNRFPVGDSPHMDKPFEQSRLKIERGDRIYLFSDGYRDQFGGELGKKFLMSNFTQLLINIHLKPFKQQRELLDTRIIDWMKDYEQIDDIMVMGIGF